MPNKTIILNGESLQINHVVRLISDDKIKVEIDKKSVEKINRARLFVDREADKKIIYGVNTGFGPMASHIISRQQLGELQFNLVRSHAVGIGKPIPRELSLAAMLIRLNTVVKGYSGVSMELAEHLRRMINERIIPIIPEHGGVGASGDLVQLAHIALAVIGEGEVVYRGEQLPTTKVFKKLGIKPYILKPKEGLSLINGTSTMTAIGAVICNSAEKLLSGETLLGALSLELVNSFSDPISKSLQEARPHHGQVTIAAAIRNILASSERLKRRGLLQKQFTVGDTVHEIPAEVQEFYSLRCIPQILGPILDTLENTKKIVTLEMNSATDNPLVDIERGVFLHGGNFHGDYVSSALDQLKMMLVKLTMLSERRINFFLASHVNKRFPPFLNLKQPGLTLALQGLQFVATSTAAHNQSLAFPNYVHSIPTNGDNQDIVSMGTDTALLTTRVIENAFVVLAIEMVTLAQTADIIKNGGQMSSVTRRIYREFRKIFPKIVEDRNISSELQAAVDFVKHSELMSVDWTKIKND